ncbi:metallophosphoesterase family protein [Lachnospiraceae bacterium 45-W7]
MRASVRRCVNYTICCHMRIGFWQNDDENQQKERGKMQNAIKKAVDLLFESLPFSKENEECKEHIMSLAVQKYERDLEEGCCPAIAAGNFLIHADTLAHVGAYLGVRTLADASGAETGKEEQLFSRVQKKLRRNCILLSIFTALTFNSVLAFFLNLSVVHLIIVIIECAAFGMLCCLLIKRQQHIVRRYHFFDTSFVYTCRKTAEEKYDLYTKKLTNTMFGMFSMAFILFFSLSLGFTSLQYTLNEAVNTVNFYLFFIFLFFYLALKNVLCRKLYAAFFCKRKTVEYMCELRRISLASACYYLFFGVVLLLLRNKMEHVFSAALTVMACYVVFALFYNVTRRRNFTGRNIVFNIRKVSCYTLSAVCFLGYSFMRLDLYLLQPYINTVSETGQNENDITYDEDSGIYTIFAKEDSFKILQLTDIHLGGSALSIVEDTKALKACNTLIEKTEPDLVVVTGDLVFPMGIMSFSFNNNAPIMQFANFMRNTGIPWVFTYGNHDTEALATLSRAEVDVLLKSLSYKTSKNLLYPYVQPDVYGRSNQMIEIRASDGSLMQALFLLDSNDYVASGGVNEYDYIHDDQVAWYQRMIQNLSEQEGYTIPSMIFTHIPLREYREANDLYESGSSEVTYYYGTLGEKMIDKICCSKYESRLFDTAVELGSTQAIFCGHDHYNNQSLQYKGIRLTYGYSIDYLAMPGIENDTEQRGATLITLHKNGTYDITPFRLIDLQ